MSVSLMSSRQIEILHSQQSCRSVVCSSASLPTSSGDSVLPGASDSAPVTGGSKDDADLKQSQQHQPPAITRLLQWIWSILKPIPEEYYFPPVGGVLRMTIWVLFAMVVLSIIMVCMDTLYMLVYKYCFCR